MGFQNILNHHQVMVTSRSGPVVEISVFLTIVLLALDTVASVILNYVEICCNMLNDMG